MGLRADDGDDGDDDGDDDDDDDDDEVSTAGLLASFRERETVIKQVSGLVVGPPFRLQNQSKMNVWPRRNALFLQN